MTRLSIRWIVAVAAMLVCAGVVCGQPVINTSPPPPNGDQGTPYSYTVTASGATGAITWSFSGGSPTWLSIDPASGSMSGTPDAPGPVSVSVVATDTVGPSSPQPFSFTINPPLQITTTSPLPGGTQGVSYSFRPDGSGGNTLAYSWIADVRVPASAPWLSVSPSGTIGGHKPAGQYLQRDGPGQQTPSLQLASC